MDEPQKISLTLTPEAMAVVQDAVESGEYASASEAVGDALLDWRAHRAQAGLGAQELRRLWDEGIASGPARFSSIDGIKAEARRRAARDKPA